MVEKFGVKVGEEKKKTTIFEDLYDRFIRKPDNPASASPPPIIIQTPPPPPPPQPRPRQKPSAKIEMPLP